MKNTNFSVPLQDYFKQIQNSFTETNISGEMVTSLYCIFYFHATTLLLYLLKKKKNKKPKETTEAL